MNIIDRLLSGLGYAKIQPGAVTERVPLAIANDYQWERDPSYLLKNNELYTKIGWIFSAVNAVSQYGAAQQYHVKQVDGEELKDIPNHEAELLIKRPNPLMSRFEFLTASFAYYHLAQNCYWWINNPDGVSLPVELWIIPPGQITPRADGKLFIDGYDYLTMTGEVITIPPEEIIHFKWFNPNNPFQGAGLFETVKYQVTADYSANRNNAAIQTTNNGAPPAILAFADTHIESEWVRIKNDLAAAAQRMMKFLPIQGVGQGGVQWLPNALSDRDMQVIEKRAFTRDEIYQIIAPGYLNMMLPNATEANAKTGKATFTEFVIYPMLTSFAEKMSNDLLPIYGADLWGEFDEVRTKDRVLELQEQNAYALTHTLEEVRKKYYNDDPLGDLRDKLLPAQITPDVGNGEEKEPEPTPPAIIQPVQDAEPVAPVDEQQPNESEPIEDDGELQAEMKRWRRVARKAIEAGKPVKDFRSTVIPAETMEAIRIKLIDCKTVADVEAAFDERKPVNDLDRAEALIKRLEVLLVA